MRKICFATFSSSPLPLWLFLYVHVSLLYFYNVHKTAIGSLLSWFVDILPFCHFTILPSGYLSLAFNHSLDKRK